MIYGADVEIDLGDEVGEHGPHRMLAGVNHKGDRMLVHRYHRAHCSITGTTGSGKGVLAKAMQISELADDVVIGVLQPKPGENGWLEGAAVVATKPHDWLEVTARAIEEMRRRLRINETYRDPVTGILGLKHIREHPDAERFPPITLYADELNGLIGRMALLKMPYAEIVALTMMFGEIGARARSTDIRLVVMTQHPTIGSNFVATEMGGALLGSIEQRIHGDRQIQSLARVFDHCGDADATVIDFITDQTYAGRFAYAFCDPADGAEVMGGQILHVPDDGIGRRFAEEHIERNYAASDLLVPSGIPDLLDIIPEDCPKDERIFYYADEDSAEGIVQRALAA